MTAILVKDAAISLTLVPLFNTLRESLFCNFYPLIGEMKKPPFIVLQKEIEDYKICL